jgi:hypothetical protein
MVKLFLSSPKDRCQLSGMSSHTLRGKSLPTLHLYINVAFNRRHLIRTTWLRWSSILGLVDAERFALANEVGWVNPRRCGRRLGGRRHL